MSKSVESSLTAFGAQAKVAGKSRHRHRHRGRRAERSERQRGQCGAEPGLGRMRTEGGAGRAGWAPRDARGGLWRASAGTDADALAVSEGLMVP